MSAHPSIALVTPSYEADFDRCRLLCESVDVFADGPFRHYLLVADHDMKLFRELAGPKRSVIPESELFPPWLRSIHRPFDRQRRRIWISTDIRRQFRPISGWHVQQMRKIAAARLIDEPAMVMADSDSIFIRPFSAYNFFRGGALRLYRKPASIPARGGRTATGGSWDQHVSWTEIAARLLGLAEAVFPADDFINNLVSWRTRAARTMIDRIEDIGGAPLELVLARQPTLSEYQLYGAFATGPGAMAGHFDSADALSHTYWAGEALSAARIADFAADMAPHQIALCVQSFTRTPIEVLRGILSANERQAVRT